MLAVTDADLVIHPPAILNTLGELNASAMAVLVGTILHPSRNLAEVEVLYESLLNDDPLAQNLAVPGVSSPVIASIVAPHIGAIISAVVPPVASQFALIANLPAILTSKVTTILVGPCYHGGDGTNA